MVNMPVADDLSSKEKNGSEGVQSGDTPERLVLRLRFSRSGPPVWLAHLDLMRTFERAVKRAKLPVQWSAGFNPRPDLVFALPIGVGLETCADYVDIGLLPAVERKAEVDVEAEAEAEVKVEAKIEAEEDAGLEIEASDLAERLNAALPVGIQIVSAQVRPAERESIMARIAFADYQLEASGLAAATEKALAQPELFVNKASKGKTRRLDILPLIVEAVTDSPDSLRLRVKAGSSENLRPDLFLAALTEYGGLAETAAADALMVRTGLYLKPGTTDNAPVDPLGAPMPPQPARCQAELQRPKSCC